MILWNVELERGLKGFGVEESDCRFVEDNEEVKCLSDADLDERFNHEDSIGCALFRF